MSWRSPTTATDIPDGLRATILDRFIRFVRGEDTHATDSGLDLGIVAAIATAHGGTVTLEPSDRGHGSE